MPKISDNKLWSHWTECDKKGKELAVSCNYCKAWTIQKNATRCRNHLIQCDDTPKDVKDKYLSLIKSSAKKSLVNISKVFKDVEEEEEQSDNETIRNHNYQISDNKLWSHWTECGIKGKELAVSCNYCKVWTIQKNATRCRNHLIQCKNTPKDVKDKYLSLIKSSAKKSSVNNSKVIRDVEEEEEQSDNETIGYHNYKISDNKLWSHWTECGIKGKELAVSCNYCKVWTIQKNATRCRNHLIQCKNTPKNVKDIYLSLIKSSAQKSLVNISKVIKVVEEEQQSDDGNVILINDIFDELREENKRLNKENKVIFGLLEKYRNISLRFQNSCLCNQKSTDFVIQSLESKYQIFKNQNVKHLTKKVKTEYISEKFSNENNGNNFEDYFNDRTDIDWNESSTDINDNNSMTTNEDTNQSIIENENSSEMRINVNKRVKPLIKSNSQRRKLTKNLNKTSKTKKCICYYEGCNQEFESKYRRGLHIKNDHLFDTSPKHSGSKNQFKCEFEGCHKVFNWRSSLEEHRARHVKNWECSWPGCDRRFGTNWEMGKHLDRHQNLKAFECHYENCGKAFYTKGELNSHMKNIHEKERPPEGTVFKCDYCVFETKFELQLKRHNTKFHTDSSELTVKCKYEGCPKMFKTKDQMRHHFDVKHRSKPLLDCDWPGCDYSTRTNNEMKIHKEHHIGARNYQCDFEGCAKSFVTDKNLWQHKLSHSKKFICSWPECGQRFSFERSLKAHTNIHLNLRPFKCYINECNKDFTIDIHLKHHLRTVHNIRQKDSN